MCPRRGSFPAGPISDLRLTADAGSALIVNSAKGADVGCGERSEPHQTRRAEAMRFVPHRILRRCRVARGPRALPQARLRVPSPHGLARDLRHDSFNSKWCCLPSLELGSTPGDPQPPQGGCRERRRTPIEETGACPHRDPHALAHSECHGSGGVGSPDLVPIRRGAHELLLLESIDRTAIVDAIRAVI